MIGVIGPLVQGKRELRGSVGSVALFALGAIGGAATTGALIGVLGALVGGRIPVIAVGAVGCALLLVDLEREYGEAFGVALRPAAVVVRDGIVSEGATVRNERQLQQLLENLESSRREVVEV